jgi:hypothetical protein
MTPATAISLLQCLVSDFDINDIPNPDKPEKMTKMTKVR